MFTISLGCSKLNTVINSTSAAADNSLESVRFSDAQLKHIFLDSGHLHFPSAAYIQLKMFSHLQCSLEQQSKTSSDGVLLHRYRS